MTKELTAKDIKKMNPDELFPPHPEASDMLVACPRDRYSASAVARAVEDADAHLLNLNVTALKADPDDTSSIIIALRVSRRDVASVARSLARYGFDTLDFSTPDGGSDTLDDARSRAAELLRYLEM